MGRNFLVQEFDLIIDRIFSLVSKGNLFGNVATNDFIREASKVNYNMEPITTQCKEMKTIRHDEALLCFNRYVVDNRPKKIKETRKD